MNFDEVFLNAQERGKFKISEVGIGFKNSKTKEITTISKQELKNIEILRSAKDHQLRIRTSQKTLSFDGFKLAEIPGIKDTVLNFYGIIVKEISISKRGYNWGYHEFVEDNLRFNYAKNECFQLPLQNVMNTQVIGKSEVALEFSNQKSMDQLVELRFYCPNTLIKDQIKKDDGVIVFKDAGDATIDGDSENEGEISIDQQQVGIVNEVALDGNGEALTQASILCNTIKQKSNLNTVQSELIVSFDELLLVTPRGRFKVDMHKEYFRLRGKSHDYKILYSAVNRLILVPKPDDMHYNFVIGIHPAIRQGQTRYPYLVFQFEREQEVELSINNDLNGKLEKTYDGPTYNVISDIFHNLLDKKVLLPSQQFASAQGYQGIKCSFKASEAILYPLENSFISIPKPPIYIPFVEISRITFSRVHSALSTTKTIEVKFYLTSGTDYSFSSIPREEHEQLEKFCQLKNLRVHNEVDNEVSVQKVGYAEDIVSESEDEDFVEAGSDSDVNEEFNENYSSASDGEGKPRRSKDEDNSGSDVEVDEDGVEEGDEEAAEAIEKPSKKQKTEKIAKPRGEKTKKKKKEGPKRPLTSFLYFCQDYRPKIRAENSGITLGEMGKLLGAKWKEISATEKLPYEEMAEQDKERYQGEMKVFKDTGIWNEDAAAQPSSSKAKGDSASLKAKASEFFNSKPKTDLTKDIKKGSTTSGKSAEFVDEEDDY